MNELIRQEAEKKINQARYAVDIVEEARQKHKKLAKDVLEEFMGVFAGMAAYFQPAPPGMPEKASADPKQFRVYSQLTVDVAAKLAPYQSPTFKAIAVMAPAPAEKPAEAPGKVIELDDPVSASRVYQRIMQRVR